MEAAEKIALSWSGGKDSALALFRLKYHGAFRPALLFTSYDSEADKVNLHAVPPPLIQAQAEALGLELRLLPLPSSPSNEVYENVHLDFFAELKAQGIRHISFGDIFLEPIRAYRDTLMEKAGLHPFYPLWNEDSYSLAEEFIERGFKAIVTAIDAEKLPEELLGAAYDERFLASLPEGADPCGENGEFHTFVFDGPIFEHPVAFDKGAVYEENYRPKINLRMKYLPLLAPHSAG